MQAPGRVVLRAAEELPAAEVRGPVGAVPRGAERHLGVVPVVVRGLAVRLLAQDAVRGVHLPHRGRALRVRRRARDQQGHHPRARVRPEEDVQDAAGGGGQVQARRLPR